MQTRQIIKLLTSVWMLGLAAWVSLGALPLLAAPPHPAGAIGSSIGNFSRESLSAGDLIKPTHTATRRNLGATNPSRPDIPLLAGIQGQVTINGAGASNISLRLIMYDQDSSSVVMTTTTQANGDYLFSGAPSLPAGKTYYVYFGPNTTDNALMYNWNGPDFTSYTAGAAANGGDFDIANVNLQSPAPGASTSLPVDFTWTRRSNVPTDTYRWRMFDPENTGPCTATTCWISTNLLGYVDHFSLTGLPSGAVYGKPYGWTLYVYDSTDTSSYGLIYYFNFITFTAGQTIYLPFAVRHH